jgi:hypothetical protein
MITAPPSPAIQADEHQRPDAGSEQSGQGHQAQRHPPDPGGLHDQESTEHGGSEQGTDRCEAAGRRHDRQGHRRGVLLRQVHRQRPEAAADRDQRTLRPEHRTEAERGQRRENDAHELPAAGRTAARLEAESR